MTLINRQIKDIGDTQQSEFNLHWTELSLHYHQKLTAASYIIFQNTYFDNTQLLVHVLLTRGKKTLIEASPNPEIIVELGIKDVDGRLINEIIEEVYLWKSGNLIPSIDEKIIEVPGEKWNQRDLPHLYPRLWEKFM